MNLLEPLLPFVIVVPHNSQEGLCDCEAGRSHGEVVQSDCRVFPCLW